MPGRFMRLNGGSGGHVYSSLFSYPLTRPYPYRWFTPVVVVGFIIFLIVFSFINFILTGYTWVSTISWNPNATIAEGLGLNGVHLPALLTARWQPTCNPIDLPLGSEFFTNQTALTYTITDVWQPNQGGAGAGNGIAPSLTYMNNVIQNCTINSVQIDFASLDRTASQLAYSEWGAVVKTYTTCSMPSPNGLTFFNTTQTYDYVPPDLAFSNLYQFLGTNFLSRNKTTRSSLYWGESLMSVYWASAAFEMQTIRLNQTANNLPAIRKGTLFFYPNDDTTITNITDPDFFRCDFRFVVDKGLGNYDWILPTTYGDYESNVQLSNLIAIKAYPHVWQDADTLAKAAYSTVLTDLGQTSAKANLLLDPDQLSYFTANFSEERHNIDNAYPGPADQKYGTEQSGPLGTTPSTITASYICQVPQRKSFGNLIISILVADVVFLQIVWLLFRWGVESYMMRRTPDAQHCQGCMLANSGPVIAVGGVGGSRNYNGNSYGNGGDGRRSRAGSLLSPGLEVGRGDHSRDPSPSRVPIQLRFNVKDVDEEEMEMGSLRPSMDAGRGRHRRAVSVGSWRERSVSRTRLIRPESGDLGAP